MAWHKPPEVSPLGRARVVVRPAFLEDVTWIRVIYHHWVMTSVATLEYTPPDQDEMERRWRDGVTTGMPWLVAVPPEDGTRVLGFAYARPFRPREGYRRTAENSIYIAPGHERRGIAKPLMRQLLTELPDCGIDRVVAVISDIDGGSIALHRWAGFEEAGVLPNAAFKFDRDISVYLMHRPVQAATEEPAATPVGAKREFSLSARLRGG
jgi:L-amino acid N-acyltransferase YncA